MIIIALLNMLEKIIKRIKVSGLAGIEVEEMLKEKEIPPRTILLEEGDVSKYVYFVKKGCLRMWLNKKGKDITIQFFFEGQAVASIDSFLSGEAGKFNLESIEASKIVKLSKENFELLSKKYPEMKEWFNELIFERFKNYSSLFISRITDSPQERYNDLLKNHPEIIKRIPQHYIASYLGITPISLSRIRNRR